MLRKKKSQECILGKRQERRSGKRAAVKGHFMLTTVEIQEKVLATELETARKKAPQQPTRKRKRLEKPPKDEEEAVDSDSDSKNSNFSDCIVVAQR